MQGWSWKALACLFLSARIASKPLLVAQAVFIDLKPRVGLIRRLGLPWSASTTLPITRPWRTHLRSLLNSKYCHFPEYSIKLPYLLGSNVGKNFGAWVGDDGWTAA